MSGRLNARPRRADENRVVALHFGHDNGRFVVHWPDEGFELSRSALRHGVLLGLEVALYAE